MLFDRLGPAAGRWVRSFPRSPHPPADQGSEPGPRLSLARGRTSSALCVAALLGTLCAAALTPTPAHAATDKIVIDEFMLRCLDGRSDGAFVELNAAGPGQTFDARFGVRFTNSTSGTVADMPGLFASRADQPWPQGQRFLLALDTFEPLTGVAPDAVLPAPPLSANGSIILYLKNPTSGALTVLQRFSYSGGGPTTLMPAPGRSLVRGANGSYAQSPEPSPTNAAGQMAGAPDCFQSVLRSYKLVELATTCAGGQPAGGFIEVGTLRTNQSFDADLRLRALDHAGVELFDVALDFGLRLGSEWALNRSWLIGPASLKSSLGAGPDQLLPAALDSVGGTLTLSGRDAMGQAVELSRLDYGTPEQPAPPAGGSLQWSQVTGSYKVAATPGPADIAGLAHTTQGCSRASSVRIEELLASCFVGDTTRRFVELKATGANEVRDSSLTLELFDGAGASLGRVSANFGSRAGEPWPVNTRWLLATDSLGNAIGSRPDAPLDVRPDTTAGMVRLTRRDPFDPKREELIQELRWGPLYARLYPGQSLLRLAENDYIVSTSPLPRNSSGAVLQCRIGAPPPQPPSTDTTLTVPVRAAEIVLICLDGSTSGQYVRLDLVEGALLDRAFSLRVYDRSGALIGASENLFAARAGERVNGSRNWLVGFSALGILDATLPVPLDPEGGAIEVVWTKDGAYRLPWKVRYDGSDGSAPPPGLAVQLTPTSHARAYPAPVNYTGLPQTIGGCYLSGNPPPSYTLDELFLSCESGDRSGGYVLVGGILAGTVPDGRVGLRMLGASGALRGELWPLFADTVHAVAGEADRHLLVAGAAFESFTGLAPDRPLPAAFEQGSGTIQLFYRDVVLGSFTLASMPYDASTSPKPGKVMVRTSSGGYGFQARIAPERFDGARPSFPPDCASKAPPLPMVLGQIVLGCKDGDAGGQFLRLDSSSTRDILEHGFTLRWFDHMGVQLAEIPDVFASHAGDFPPQGQSLLIAPAVTGLPAQDVPMPAALDTLGGELALVRSENGVERESWRHRYTREGIFASPFGSAFRPIAGGQWIPETAGRQGWTGDALSDVSCYIGHAPMAIRIRQVMGACGTGSIAQSFVELVTTSDTPVDPWLGLRISDRNRSQRFDRLLSGVHPFQRWPAGRHYLVATDSLRAITGVAPDALIPFGIGDTPATIELYTLTSAGGVTSTISLATPDFITLPQPGSSLLFLTPGAQPVTTPNPDPMRLDGARPLLSLDCGQLTGLADAVRLASVLLRCGKGSSLVQFVQVDRTSVLAGKASRLMLRIRDRSDKIRGQVDHLFSGSPGVFWGTNASLVVGSAAFEGEYRIPPDALLPAEMDTLAGSIELVLPGSGGDRVLDALHYGPNGVPVPGVGVGLRYTAGTGWQPDARVIPVGLNGPGSDNAGCASLCGIQNFRLSLGGAQYSVEPRGSFSGLASQVSYDIPRGEFDVSSQHAHALLRISDNYTLVSAAPAAESLLVTVQVFEHHADTCITNRCTHSTRRLHLFVNDALVDSLPLAAAGTGRLQARVGFSTDRPVVVEVLADVEGQLLPPLIASLAGRLSIERPRDGVRLVSCFGYDSERARVVREPEVHVGMREVSLAWPAQADSGFSALVERRDESDVEGLWTAMETRPLEASGFIRYVDRRVEHEHAYRYRLGWSDRYGDYRSDEARVQVPRSFGFALFGARPNPARGALAVWFELPEAADTHLEVFDVLGRRVREVREHYAAGPRSVAVDRGTPLPPGLYQVRLRADGREARLSAVVVP